MLIYDRRLMRGKFLIVLIACVGIAAPSAQVPAMQTPDAFFGHRMGADRELADWPGLQRYFETIAAASDRVELVDAGPTTEGRRLIAAVVSSADNIKRLDEIRTNALKLADPRTTDEAAAGQIIERQPVIVAIGMSIHATEIAATQTAPELLHTLATSRDPEIIRSLDNLVLILFPSLNPDGHSITVDWYRKWKGTEFEGSPMPWLYHKYVGHDINRDAFMMNMAENRTLADFFYRRWHPQVFLTMHQMGPRGARYFVPPNVDPIDRNYDPLVWRTAGLLGHAMALALEEDGRTGVLQNALYDYYWPGYEDSAPIGHNTVTLLTEAASVRIASPINVPADQLTGGRGFPDHQPSITFPNPWPGGTWTLRNIVDYNLSAARGLITGSARYRADLVRNFYRMGKRQVELGAQGGPFAFIIPHDQFDPHAMKKLEELLLQGAVEIRRTLEPFRYQETVYQNGADIIFMAQPFRAYAKTLLDVQQYPVRRLAAGAAADRPYDVAGWTLPIQMNVRVDRVEQYFDPGLTTRLERAGIAPQKVWGDVGRASFFVMDARGNAGSIAINRLLKTGARVAFLSTPLQILGFTYEPGSVLVTESKGVRDTVEKIAADLGLRATASGGRLPSDARPIGRSRVGLYKPWVENIDEGWTRWLLEQYEFEFDSISDADIRKGGLRPRFDAIVIPDIGAERIMSGHVAGTMPPEYAGGIGADGAEQLRQFVAGGGTLITLDSSSDLAITLLGAPLRDVTRGLPVNEYFCPGSIVRLELESDPLTFGVPRESAGFCSFNAGYDIAAGSTAGAAAATARIIGRYAKSNVLMSGWLEGEKVIAGKGAMVEVKSGQGRAVLFGFRPQHRGQAHATFRLLFNAIHTSK
jgi:hypothetical protein